MAFTSANLKLLYEYLRASGYGLSASQVAQLFRAGQLDRILKAAQDHAAIFTGYTQGIAETRAALAVPSIEPSVRTHLELLLATYETLLEEYLSDVDQSERWH